MTVRDNIAFGLKVRKVPKAEIKRAGRRAARPGAALAATPAGTPRSSPAASGSASPWRGRCARPKVLLLDEPFGALDAKVRDELRHLAAEAPRRGPRHQPVRHPRPARGVRGLRPDRRPGRGPGPADRPAPGALRAARDTRSSPEFLGPVNVLPLRADRSPARGPPTASSRRSASPTSVAEIYVRPHDLDVQSERNGKPYWPARVDGSPPSAASSGSTCHRRAPTAPARAAQRPPRTPASPRGDEVYVIPRLINIFDPQSHTFHPVALGGTSRVPAAT